MSDGWTGSWCAQCGPDVSVDEDGCCATCGADAVGEGAEKAIKLRKAASDFMEYLDEIMWGGGSCGVCGARGSTHEPGTHCDAIKKALEGLK